MLYEYSSSFRPVKTRVFFFVFLYGVAANIPFWIASRSVGLLMTGLFNAEFLIIGILSVFVRRKLTVGLLLVAIFLDIVRGINVTYMLSPSEMLRSARYLSIPKSLPLWDVVMVVICIAMISLIVAVASSDRASGRERRFIAMTLAAVVLFCGVVDVKTGHTVSFRGDSLFSIPRLTRFPTHSLVMSELEHESFKSSVAAGKDVPVPSASTRLVGLDTMASMRASAALPNVVLILVESWGKPRAADLEEALVRPYADVGLAARYEVRQGTGPFHGGTRETARPTAFLAVGDHAPPFSSVKLRSQFSDEVVPYVLLEPKADEIKETLPKASSFVVAMHSPSRMHRSRFRKISLSGSPGGQ